MQTSAISEKSVLYGMQYGQWASTGPNRPVESNHKSEQNTKMQWTEDWKVSQDRKTLRVEKGWLAIKARKRIAQGAEGRPRHTLQG